MTQSPSRPPRNRIRTLLPTVALAAAITATGCVAEQGVAERAAEDAAAGSPTEARPSRETLLLSLVELDGIVERTMDRTGVPGVAVAVVSGDEVLHARGYGARSTETGGEVDAETVFQIASMSKPISSTVMSAMVGAGHFEWDDPVSEHTDQFTLADPWVSRNVTFADLFAHRSGLPGGPAGNDLEAVGVTRDEILDRLREVPLGPFRQDFSYSNWGMTLGGEAAAITAGTTWEDASEEYLFGPAGMSSTSMRHDDFLAHGNRAELHVETPDGWRPDFERMPDGQAPAGGVSSNVSDLAKWARLQLRNGHLDGQQLVEPDALDQTHTPHVTKSPAQDGQPASTYGLGWNVGTNPLGLLEWNHSGAFSTGAATAVKLVPEADLGIVVLTNGAPIGVPEAIGDEWLAWVLTGGTDHTDWMGMWRERMSGLYGQPLEVPDPDEPRPARDTGAYEGTYSNDYVGDVAVSTVDGGLALLLGPDDMVFPLEHADADTFVYLDAPELPGFPALARFSFSDEPSRAARLNLSSFDGAGLGTLERSS